MTSAAIAFRSIEGRALHAVRRGLLISLSLDGLVAWGEASPLPGRSAESIEDVLRALKRLGPALAIDPVSPMETVDPALPASLRFALEIAALRLARALAGSPIEAPRLEMQVLGDDLASIDRELEAHRRGARSFKLKIRSETDARRVARLRALAPDARIRVDANRAFARADDVPWDLLRDADVEWIEEPTRDAAVLSDTPVAIALDESIEDDRERALDAIRARRIAAVVLKPTMLGARTLLSIGAIARAHGVRTVVSHAFESEVGRVAAMELAALVAPDECHGLAPWPGIESFVEGVVLAAPPLV